MNKVLILVLVSLLLAGCGAAAPTATAALPTPAPAFSQIIAFGDDLSDTGLLYAAWKEAVAQGIRDSNDLKHWEANDGGRFSNGPLAVEILADRLKVSLKSFAVGAALSGQGNVNSDMASLNNSGLLGQIDQFEKGLNGAKADPDALYFINTSQADIFVGGKGSGTDHINFIADQTLEHIRTAITRLAKLGAKQFMFWNTSDIAPLQPGFVINDYVAEPKVYQDRMNSELPGLISDLEKQLDIKIEPFDYRAVDAQIRDNPEKYGLTNFTDACTQWSESSEICANPDEYYFWSDYSLTGRIHQILGEAMADQLKK